MEEYLDGKFFLKSNLLAKKLSTAKVVQTYKQLQEVERAFLELKDFLKIKPIFHYADERVIAHVFFCVLAYLLRKDGRLILSKRVAYLFSPEGIITSFTAEKHEMQPEWTFCHCDESY